MVGELIAGRYRMLERHAVGGMATVWRAHDEHTGEQVALKRIHPHLVADPAARARLDREAAALRLVDHPAIVHPRDVVEDPDEPALVMDFADGRPLSDRIAAGPLPVEEAVAIAATIADALAVAHAHGIVHRDIKPANILIEEDGTLHLIDFGIASLRASGSSELTDARSMVGTLRYAAPERLAGEPATPRSDVWALGAVLSEMLTGHPVMAVDDPAAALAASRTALPPMDGLPARVASVIRQAMAPDPARRYPDAAAFRDALAALDDPVDPDAPTDLVPLLPPRPSSGPLPAAIRRRPAIGLGAALVAAVLVIVAATGPFMSPEADPAAGGDGQLSVQIPAGPIESALPTPEPTPGIGHGNRGRGHGNGKGKD